MDHPETLLFVEIGTDLIYECQLYENFVLFRSATPGFEDTLRKYDYPSFHRQFREFYGDPEEFYDKREDDVEILISRY